jgi:plastocyanin
VNSEQPDQAARARGNGFPFGSRGRLLVLAVGVIVVCGFAGLALRSSASAATGAVAKVSVSEKGFTPAVVVVPIGTVVQWRNNGTSSHSLKGQVRSPSDLQPGQSYERRFTSPGDYSYHDGDDPEHTATVVVVAGSGQPPRAPGTVTYHYSAVLKLFVNDQWTYYDPEWGTLTGPCNGQTGTGKRLIHLDVVFPNVTYERVASISVEALTSPPVPGRFGDSGETIKSQIAGPSSPIVACPRGVREPTANQPANCYRSFTGKHVLLSLSWSPVATKDRFLISNGGPAITPSSCGSQIVGALVLIGVKKPVLPLNLVGYRVDYDEGQTNAATLAEVEAMRAGRAFTVARRVDLNFTTPCCEGFNPGRGGIWARIGNIHRYIASLTITFTPRG